MVVINCFGFFFGVEYFESLAHCKAELKRCIDKFHKPAITTCYKVVFDSMISTLIENTVARPKRQQYKQQ